MLPAGAQLLASDPLLLLSASVEPGQRVALSLPGAPFAADWSELLAPNLRGSPDGRGGDQLVFWLASEQRFETAFKLDATGHPELDGAVFTTGASVTGTAGILPASSTPKPGDAFWVENRGDTPAILSLPLRLNRAPQTSLHLTTGLNVIGSPYAAAISPATADTGTAGFQPAPDSRSPSPVSPSSSRLSALDLTPADNFPASVPWWEIADTDSSLNVVRPCDDLLPPMPDAPALAGAECSGDRNEVILNFPVAGTLEIFRQSIDPVAGLRPLGAWKLAGAMKVDAGACRVELPAAPEAAAAPQAERPAQPRLDAWVCVLARDADGDGVSDAVEVLQDLTNPLDPENRPAADGDPLAEWRRLVQRAHFDAMMRSPETQVVFVDPENGDDALDGSRADLADRKGGAGPKRTLAAAVAGRSGTLVLDLAPGVHPLPVSGLPRYDGALTYNTARGPVHFATPDILSRRGQSLLSPGRSKP
ncbi:MAG: hypothetical protein U1F77_06110 [Kiritimatiellia bacterium]